MKVKIRGREFEVKFAIDFDKPPFEPIGKRYRLACWDEDGAFFGVFPPLDEDTPPLPKLTCRVIRWKLNRRYPDDTILIVEAVRET